MSFGDLEREYHIYLPRSVCDTRQEYAPMLLAIHCFGCNAANEEQKYIPVAEEFGFVLVTPEGIGESWNARYCCGPALSERLDDVSFLEHVVHEASTLVRVSPDVYVTGFSNGGFMTSFLAASGRSWVRAVAPTAGHVYAHIKPSHPTPLFLHHGYDDQSVNFNGCCAANHCCCGIVSKACVSVPDIFHEWLRINGCSGHQPALTVPGHHLVECFTGTGCEANTTYCAHHNVPHTSWGHHFNMATDIGRFFALDACRQHGVWDGAACTCTEGFSGRYCTLHQDGPPPPIKPKPPRPMPVLTPGGTSRNSAEGAPGSQHDSPGDWSDYVMGGLGLLTIGMTVTVYMCGVGSNGGPRRAVRVPAEDEEMTAAPGATPPKRREPR
eukprot:EG_transcript_11346